MSSSESTDDDSPVRVELLNWPMEPLGMVTSANVPNIPVTPLDYTTHRLGRPRYVYCKKKGDLNRYCREIRMMESKPLLTCRSNEHGIEVVLSYVWVDLTEDPTYMAWRTFKVQERKYTLFDKAAAAIFFGLHKFKSRLTSDFTIVTDYKPLVAIYNPTNLHERSDSLPLILKIVAEELTTYTYKIIYRTNAQIKESLK